MKAKPKRAKAYRPKFCAINPMATFMGGMSGQHADHLTVLSTKTALAMANLVTGCGGRDDWDRVVGAINMGNVMCEQGFGAELRADMLAGRDALLAMGVRARRLQRFLFTGTELQLVNTALDGHAAQLVNVRMIDVERASDEVLRRIRHGVNTVSVRGASAPEVGATPIK